jgi:hypothetical protein
MGHVAMRQVIVDAPGKNGRIVILNDDGKTAREIAGGSCVESDNRLFAQKTMRLPPARGRAALMWITAAFLATTWASETQGFPEARHAQADALANAQRAIAARKVDFGRTAGDLDFETVQASRFGDKLVSIAQATTGDTEELQKALEEQHRRAERLARELTIARHLEMLLTLYKARAESARFNQVSESEYAELRKSLQQERDQLKQSSESGAAELCKSLQGDRADRLEQGLAAAKRDVETQTALATKANDDATQLKQAAESDAAELKKSLQLERGRAERLQQDLAAARRDVETQTALAARANDDATELKQAAESGAAELKKSLQQERGSAERLRLDLAAARRDVETQTALATKANDDATQLKQAAESGAAELKESLQQERGRAEQLEQDLAAARRDVETQTALATKANDDATQLKQAAESGAAELKKSLQQERGRAEQLEQDLAAARRDVETQTALAARANDDATQLKKVAENGPAGLKQLLQQEHDRAEALAQDLSTAHATIYAYEAQARKDSDQATDLKQGAESCTAELSKSLQQERERAERLEQDLAAARRDVETQTVLACKASQEASQLKQVAENGPAGLKQLLQQEHDRAEALAQDLSMARATIYAYEAQARKAGEQAVDLKQAAESGAAELRKSLQQERERAARLEQDLAAARRDVETQTALAARTNDDATQLKQAAESDAAELSKSLQQERGRAEQLEQDLAAARRDVETQTALASKASQEAQLKQVAEIGSAELKRLLQQEHHRAEALAQDLSTARTKIYAYEAQTVEMGPANVAQARECSAAMPAKPHAYWSYRIIDGRKCWYEGKPMLSKSLLHWPAQVPAQSDSVKATASIARKAGEQAADLKQAAESGAAELRKSLQQERERAARLGAPSPFSPSSSTTPSRRSSPGAFWRLIFSSSPLY